MLKFVPKSLWRSLRPQNRLPVREGELIPIADSIPTGTSDPVIRKILWPTERFEAKCVCASATGDTSIRFPSPLPQGHPAWDTVVLDWHIARNRAGESISGPACLVLDILHGGNLISGYIAKTMAKTAFMALSCTCLKTGTVVSGMRCMIGQSSFRACGRRLRMHGERGMS